MGVYVFAPAGPERLQNSVMEKCVKYIGSQQIGGGSDIAKGRRYLKHKLGCSIRAVKRTINKQYKIINNSSFTEFGIAVYYFHSEYCVKIVEETIKYIENSSYDNKKEIFGCLPSGAKFLDLAYSYRISQLEWVVVENYQDQGKMAKLIYDNFEKLRNDLEA